MKKIKHEALKQINKWLKEFSSTVQDNCDYYAFYRAKVYSTEDGIICIQFLTSNIKGILKAPCLQYNSATGEMQYDYEGRNLNFTNEAKVKEAIHTLVEHISSFKQPVNRFLFDTCIYNAEIREGFVRDDNVNKGEIIMYFVSTDPYEINYNIAEVTNDFGLELCGNWSSEAEVEFENFINAGC